MAARRHLSQVTPPVERSTGDKQGLPTAGGFTLILYQKNEASGRAVRDQVGVRESPGGFAPCELRSNHEVGQTREFSEMQQKPLGSAQG